MLWSLMEMDWLEGYVASIRIDDLDKLLLQFGLLLGDQLPVPQLGGKVDEVVIWVRLRVGSCNRAEEEVVKVVGEEGDGVKVKRSELKAGHHGLEYQMIEG